MELDWKELILAYITASGFISYLPQIIKILKTKSVEDVATSSWAIWTLNSGLYLLYIILSEVTIWLILSQLLEVILVGTTFILVLIFKKRSKDKS